jgi:hypothetical protein
MIELRINNQRIMLLKQPEEYGDILVEAGSASEVDDVFTISNGDFLMLINYYRHQKENGLEIFNKRR